MKTNFEHTFIQLIKVLDVPVTKTSALERLQSHPDEGSLLAYSETLNHYKIENAGIKVDKEKLHELPVPFVAYLHLHGGTFTLVKEVTHHHVHHLLDTQKGWNKTGKDEFLKAWQGIALLAEASSESGEKDFAKHRRSEILKELRVPLAVSLLLLTTGIFTVPLLTATSSLLLPLLILLKTGGVVTSTLLLVKTIDSKNELVNRLCNNGPKINCQSILDSPAAQLTPWLSLSDLGFIYFFGSFFALLFSGYAGTQHTFISFQWIFSSGCIAFGAYSLWYQGVKAKMWCTLCLAVVSIFVLELLTLIRFTPSLFRLDTAGIAYMVAGFLLPITFLLLFKNSALKAREAHDLTKKLNKIYANPAYFKSLMGNQQLMPEIPEYMPVVVFGRKDAIHTITVVSNPLCTPCAIIHQKLEEVIEENPGINCQVIFLSGENNAGGQFVQKLWNLPDSIRPVATSRWYYRNDKNFEKWNEEYITYPEEINRGKHIQKMHNDWANYAEIKATPTLFVNGRKKPDEISIKELGRLLSSQREAFI